MKIVFFGTPDFAVASLKLLVDSGCDIAAVVTVADKPAGRGLQIQQSPVKKYAQENGLKVLQPEKLKDENFITELTSLNADLFIVIAFRMLPEIVWTMPRIGTFNLHASLLPKYRGAAPINWAIINGETETGITTFFLKHEIDTGQIIMQQKVEISESATAGELYNELMNKGALLVLETIKKIKSNKYVLTEQIGDVIHAPKIFKPDCEINFNQSVNKVYNHIRGLSPYPAAFTYLNTKTLKIFLAEKSHQKPTKKMGDYETDNKTYLKFACIDGWIDVKEIQLEGKQKMNIVDFLRGWR